MADSQKQSAAAAPSSPSPSPSSMIDAFVGTANMNKEQSQQQDKQQNESEGTAAASQSKSRSKALIKSFSGVEVKPHPPPRTIPTASKPKEGTSMVQGLIQALSGAMVYTDVGNLETNRRLWNRYAEEWHEGDKASRCNTTSSTWVQEMAAHTSKTSKKMPHDTPQHITVVGEEWSSQEDLEEVLHEFLLPYLTPEGVVAEVGVGGGRVAMHVMGKCSSLTCLDISVGMLAKAKAALLAHPAANTVTKLDFVLLGDSSAAASSSSSSSTTTTTTTGSSVQIEYPTHLHSTFDFLYSFDCLVHVDLHTLYQTLHQIRMILKPGGKAFLSTANLLTPAGFRRFAAQVKYTVGGFYFLSPDIVTLLLKKAGLKVLKTSEVPEGFKEFSDDKGPAKGNLYYGRDFLVVVERMERQGGGRGGER
ncbi:hypothetical protein VYU27_004953 [Nannochloropsis oceanica]